MKNEQKDKQTETTRKQTKDHVKEEHNYDQNYSKKCKLVLYERTIAPHLSYQGKKQRFV